MTSAAEERASIVAWLRGDALVQAARMTLAAGLPGGTRTERVRGKAFADGTCHAISCIIAAIERGAHLAAPQEGK